MAKTYLNIPVPTPTQNAVPSADIRDHVFGGAKVDEFVTSLVNTYIDRFGKQHYTIEGLRWLAQQAIAAFGWIPVGTFQAGATLTLPNQILKDETDGEYYRWDGSFSPSGKIVPAGSTPASSGGVGVGAWLSIGDSVLRHDLEVVNSSGALPVQERPYVAVDAILDIGDTQPDKSLRGTGDVKAFGIDIALDELTYNPAKENVFYTPGSFLRQKTGEPYPTRENPDYPGQCYRFVLSQGSKLKDATKSLQWVTAVGNTIGCDPEDWVYVDAFGTNALMYAGRVSRTVAVGSESMAWFGARSQSDLIKNCHDY